MDFRGTFIYTPRHLQRGGMLTCIVAQLHGPLTELYYRLLDFQCLGLVQNRNPVIYGDPFNEEAETGTLGTTQSRNMVFNRYAKGLLSGALRRQRPE